MHINALTATLSPRQAQKECVSLSLISREGPRDSTDPQSPGDPGARQCQGPPRQLISRSGALESPPSLRPVSSFQEILGSLKGVSSVGSQGSASRVPAGRSREAASEQTGPTSRGYPTSFPLEMTAGSQTLAGTLMCFFRGEIVSYS